MNSKAEQKFDFAVGGQAVIEGVMMRSNGFITVAVRKEDGTIRVKDDPFKSISSRIKFLGLPFIRGVVGLGEMMMVGMKSLNYSANQMIEEPGQENVKKTKANKIIEGITFAFSFVFAISLSLFLFKFLPLWITEWVSGMYPSFRNSILYNVLDGVLKTSFFILYIFLLGFMPSIKRVFQYHGAEHKSIFTYEEGLPLTVENARKQSRFHPRCGTSFIFIVFMISILIYVFLPRNPDFTLNFLNRLFLLPIIAGISYEFLKWSARNQDNPLIKILIAPGLAFQRLTTREPDDKQLEVGLNALQKALDLEAETSLSKKKKVLFVP
ncbi:DUF1385 domain-containing protein [bacterium]|nr:DUF1385 domain-containing protein [bacterium]